MTANFDVFAVRSPGLTETAIDRILGKVYARLLALGERQEQKAADPDSLKGQTGPAASDTPAAKLEVQPGV